MNNAMQEKWLRVALWQTPGIGVARFTHLLVSLGSAREVFASPESILTGYLPKKVVDAVKAAASSLSIEAMQSHLKQWAIKVVVKDIDPDYPRLLSTISQSPPVLYIKGTMLPGDTQALAVVGTRKPTNYGLEVTKLIAGELASQGITIVSGLAYGIDAQAHRAALESGGRTIAVLAHGLDRVYPSGNEKLAADIAKNGALISAFPPLEPPSRGHFVARDEWIAMLSLGVLVTEGAAGSGSLLTATSAQKLGKPVFAVPGPITSVMNHAPTQLLKSGAKLVTTAQDIVNELGLSGSRHMTSKKHVVLENDRQQQIFGVLSREAHTLNELSRVLSVPVSLLTPELTLMELEGVVKQVGDLWQVT